MARETDVDTWYEWDVTYKDTRHADTYSSVTIVARWRSEAYAEARAYMRALAYGACVVRIERLDALT